VLKIDSFSLFLQLQARNCYWMILNLLAGQAAISRRPTRGCSAEHYIIITSLTNHYVVCCGHSSSFVLQKMHDGDLGLETHRRHDCFAGCTAADRSNSSSKCWVLRYISQSKQPESSDFFCRKSLKHEEFAPEKWRFSRENGHSQPQYFFKAL
jgi:hypothetical protein